MIIYYHNIYTNINLDYVVGFDLLAYKNKIGFTIEYLTF